MERKLGASDQNSIYRCARASINGGMEFKINNSAGKRRHAKINRQKPDDKRKKRTIHNASH